MKALRVFDEYGRLKIEEGDIIIVLDGRPDHYWWQGQNKRTCEVGTFPRQLLNPQRRKTGRYHGLSVCCETMIFNYPVI